MKAPKEYGKKVNDPSLLDQAIARAGSGEALAELLGTKPGNVSNYKKRGVPTAWAMLLRWWLVTGEWEPPSEAAIYREFTAAVAGHKQLRKVVLALADSEEVPLFERAMKQVSEE